MDNLAAAFIGAVLGVLIVSGVSFKVKPTIYSSARRACNLESSETKQELVVSKKKDAV